jgi:DNA polymerase I-like protein with 3'-5' exonuclease and polymerase domains
MIYYIDEQKELFENEIYKKATLQQCLEYFKDKDVVEVDTETEFCPWSINKTKEKSRLPDPYTSKVLCIQLGDFDNQFVINCATTSFIEVVKILLEDATKLKIFTNAFFDLRFIFHWGINPVNICDIFLQEMILTRGMEKPKGYRSLEGMALRYLGVQLNKEVRGQIQWRGLDSTVIKYAAEDVMYQNKIRLIQKKQLSDFNLQRYADLENRYVLDLARTSYLGFGIDVDKWKKVEENNLLLLEEYRKKLDDWVINNLPKFTEQTLFWVQVNVKWTSFMQVIPVMKELGVDLKVLDKETNEEKESVGLKLLQKQSHKSDLIPIYIRFKELAKEVSTYGSKFLLENLNPVTKRVHSEFFQILETGRISSNKPNIQNIPGELNGETHPLRRCFKPSDGNTFIVADYSQQEPRITADYSQDEYLIDFILNGSGDSHSLIATMISEYLLGEHIEVTKHNNPFVPKFGKNIRSIGKTINLGKDYGKSAYTTAPDLGISVEEAQQLFNIIDSKTPKKIAYFKRWQEFVEKNGFIRTDDVVGSITWFSDYERYKYLKSLDFNEKSKREISEFYKLKGAMERFAQNNRIQGSASLMTKIAHIYINDEFVKRNIQNKAFICALIHDEIVAESSIELKEEVADIMKECMERAGRIFCKTIPMKVEPKITMEWLH